MGLPQNLEEFREKLYDLLDQGVFDGTSRSDIADAIEEIVLLIELRAKPSPSQLIVGRMFVHALEEAGDDEV